MNPYGKTPLEYFHDRLKWAELTVRESMSSATVGSSIMDTAERRMVELRAAYAALAGIPDQAACSARYAAVEAAYDTLLMEAKAYDLQLEGRRWVNSYRLARTEKEKQEKYALAKKIWLEFEVNPSMKAQRDYPSFYAQWKSIETNNPAIDTSLVLPTADQAAAANLKAAKAKFDEKKNAAMTAITSGRSSLAEAQRAVNDLQAEMQPLKGTACEAESAGALLQAENALSIRIKHEQPTQASATAAPVAPAPAPSPAVVASPSPTPYYSQWPIAAQQPQLAPHSAPSPAPPYAAQAQHANASPYGQGYAHAQQSGMQQPQYSPQGHVTSYVQYDNHPIQQQQPAMYQHHSQMAYNHPQTAQYVQPQSMYQHSGYASMQPQQYQPHSTPSNYSPFAPVAQYVPQLTQQPSPSHPSYAPAAPVSQPQYPQHSTPSYPSYPPSPAQSPLQNSAGNNFVYFNSFDLTNFVRSAGIAEADAMSFVQRATAEGCADARTALGLTNDELQALGFVKLGDRKKYLAHAEQMKQGDAKSGGKKSMFCAEFCINPKEVVVSGKPLGQGNFAVVYPGTFHMAKVAIKFLLNAQLDEQSFQQEARTLHELTEHGHPNVIRFFGICMMEAPHRAPALVMEFLSNGSLKAFLDQHGPQLRQVQLLHFAKATAAGMLHLASLSPPILHRDLAARNLLVGDLDASGNYALRVADFGLARAGAGVQGDYRVANSPSPTRWTAPEVWQRGQYTVAADVWSFGIALWEIFSLGQRPYGALSDGEVLPYLQSGRRLEQVPPGARTAIPDDMYKLMWSCWVPDPMQRPAFAQLYQQLDELENRERHTNILM